LKKCRSSRIHPYKASAKPLTIISGKTQSYTRLRLKKMYRDPVCGMVLDENTAKYKITYQGETYHFCSVACKKKFKRRKTKFIK
jgi:YHS domain-containing protein